MLVYLLQLSIFPKQIKNISQLNAFGMQWSTLSRLSLVQVEDGKSNRFRIENEPVKILLVKIENEQAKIVLVKIEDDPV